MSRYVATDHQNALPFHIQPSSDTLLLHQERQPERGPSPSLPRARGNVVPSQPHSPQNASRRKQIETSPESVRGPAKTSAHRRSSSLSGVNPGVANLNRWSRSTASSVGSTHSTHQQSPSTRRMSLSGSTTFLLGADGSSPPPKKLYKNNPSATHSSSSTRPTLDPSLTLPPIVTLPSLHTFGKNGTSPLNGPITPSPSTAGILSAAVRTTVPDYFSGPWDETTPRAFTATADSPPTATGRDTPTSKRVATEEDNRKPRGHSRQRSGKGSNNTRSNRHSKQPSQKNMLSKALQKANTAVLLDNAQNFEGAMEAYSEACSLLQQVMTRSSGDEDRRKLEAIRNTYTSRINELKRITPHLQDDGKALPDRPESGSYKGAELQAAEEEEEPVIIETATVTRIANDQSYILDSDQPRSISASQLPVRRESLMPAFDPAPYGRLDPSVDRSHSKSPMKERTSELNSNLAPPMDTTYMPPPLSPRYPSSPMTFPPEHKPFPKQQVPDRHTTNNPGAAPSKGHAKKASNESMSWLDTIDESGGSGESVHSRSSSMGVRRKRIRAASGATEAEFDAALDAAVEAAYDDGFEPMDSSEQRGEYDYDDADDDDEIVANVRRKVELAKERVRQTERETAIHDARERERKRLFRAGIEPESNVDNEYDNESEEEERMLEEMTRDYVMDGFEFGLQSKSALPRESDSSGFSGRTWNSSIGSNPTTAGTTLSTVTEASAIPEVPTLQNKTIKHPPPPQSLPPLPPSNPASQQAFGAASQGVRGRRLSGQQNLKQLKIETTSVVKSERSESLSQPPSLPPPRVPGSDAPGTAQIKTAGLASQRQPSSGIAARTPIPQSARKPSSPFPPSNPAELVTPPTPTLVRTFTNDSDSNSLPRSGSPGRAQSRAGLRKNFSSSSLKNMKNRNLSVSNADDGSDVSPNTPGSSHFNPRDVNGRLPAMPTLPTPIATAFKDKMNGPAGGLYLFNSDIYSSDSPGSPNPLAPDAPIPLEPCPNEYLLRPFWLMRALYQTIAHPRGGYISTKLFIPRDVWRVKGVKIKSIEDKVANCDFLTAALMKLSRVDTFDADAVLEEMQSLEGVLEQVQITLTKKLGNEVGVQGSGGIFKDMPMGGDAEGNTTSSKSGSTSSKSSFSWRRLRSKNSGAALSNTYTNKSPLSEGTKEGLSMSTLPMTSTSLARVRHAKRDVNEVQYSGPNANYMGALARLFDAAQTIDQIARQVEDPGLRHADKTQVGLELCTRHAAEFFGFYVCRFVLADVALLLDKFIKRGSEWVLV